MGWTHVEIRENNWKSYRMETKHKKLRGRPKQDGRLEGQSGHGIENEVKLAKERNQWKW